MKQIQFLVPLIFFLLSAVLTLSVNPAEAQKIPEVVTDAAGISVKENKDKTGSETKDKTDSVKVDALDSNALKELSDSTQMTLDEKKKDVSNTVVAGQKAMAEKEHIQNKADKLKNELEETKTKIKETGSQISKHDRQQLQHKSRQLENEYKTLQKKLETKDEIAKKAFAESSKKQDEIEQLKEQLHNLQLETSKRYSPRKKALIMGSIVLITIIVLFIKDKLVSLFENRLITRGEKKHSVAALRVRTLLRIFNWSMSVLLIAIAIFLILELFGFNSTHTLAGAGIFGVAIGFGAQQFIKDIFSGIFLVLEGQFGVNDYITAGQHSGNVEDINLRFTKLRSYDGNIIYIPNGDIHSVVNYGKGYANSVIKFYVDINQNIDQVFALIRDVVSELRSAPDLVDEILSDVELLGINAFTPTGVEVKFRIKTAPQSQWMVGREVRLALKNRFDLDGITLFQYKYENHPVKSL